MEMPSRSIDRGAREAYNPNPNYRCDMKNIQKIQKESFWCLNSKFRGRYGPTISTLIPLKPTRRVDKYTRNPTWCAFKKFLVSQIWSNVFIYFLKLESSKSYSPNY